MSRFGEWDQAQVLEEAKKIEDAARNGDSSKAFRDEDARITRSSVDPEVRRANAAAVTAQLERDGFLPVCGFDLAAAAHASYRAPQCGDTMGNTSNILTNSPSESIERAIYNRESYASNLQFGDSRPSVPKAPKAESTDSSKSANNGSLDRKSEMEMMQARLEAMRSELERIKAERKNADTPHDGKHHGRRDRHSEKNEDHDARNLSKPKSVEALPDVHKAKPNGADKLPHLPNLTEKDKHDKKPDAIESAKRMEELKAAEQLAARAHLKEMIGKLDLTIVAQRLDPNYGLKQAEVRPSVAVNTSKDGTMHIAGEPYGYIDLNAQTKLKVEKDGSILATDSKGTTYHFLSNPDKNHMLLETTDKENNKLRKFAPNDEKLISEKITRNKDGGYTSFKQYNTKEEPVVDHIVDPLVGKVFGPLLNPLNTNREDWVVSTTKIYGKDDRLQTETVDYGKSQYSPPLRAQKIQETFHYDPVKRAKDGVAAEHTYDNGFKYTELVSGQTYIQRRVVNHDVDPIKFENQSNKNGSVKYQGVDWALSNKQLREGVHIDKGQRDLPEIYFTWRTEGELEP